MTWENAVFWTLLAAFVVATVRFYRFVVADEDVREERRLRHASKALRGE